MKLKKLLIAMLSYVMLGAIGIGFAGCETEETGKTNNSSLQQSGNSTYIPPVDNSMPIVPETSQGDSETNEDGIQEEYAIHYTLNGGVNNEKNPVVGKSGDSIWLSNPTKEGNTFVGWFDNADFEGEAITYIPDNQNSDVYLYACFDYGTPGLHYGLQEDNTYSVEWYDGKAVKVKIPSTYRGKSVAKIGDRVFGNGYADYIKEVIIEEGITSIDDEAFYGCEELLRVTIPNSITYVGDDVFQDCDSLEYIEKDNLKYLGNDTNPYIYLLGMSVMDVVSVSIQEGCKFIGDWALAHNIKLSHVDFPNTIISIGCYAFDASWGLINIDIPYGVESIREDGFANCNNLETVKIPETVTFIDMPAFVNCWSLKEIDVHKNNPMYKDVDGDLYTKDGSVLIKYASGKIDESFAVPDGVDTIEECAFSESRYLADVTIPDSVVSIGRYAFQGVYNLKSINIPGSVTTIEYGTFSHCSQLMEISVDEDNLTYRDIDGNLYTKDGSVLIQYAIGKGEEIFEVPEEVVTIVGEAFGYLEYTVEYFDVVIGKNVTTIEERAFVACGALRNIYYKGTKMEWDAIFIGDLNVYIYEASCYCYSEKDPPLNEEGTGYNGNYWHYGEDGDVVVWSKENL